MRERGGKYWATPHYGHRVIPCLVQCQVFFFVISLIALSAALFRYTQVEWEWSICVMDSMLNGTLLF